MGLSACLTPELKRCEISGTSEAGAKPLLPKALGTQKLSKKLMSGLRAGSDLSGRARFLLGEFWGESFAPN
jgi:hypothetical protein